MTSHQLHLKVRNKKIRVPKADYSQIAKSYNELRSRALCKATVTVKEALELIEAGYEYVCDMENAKLFRKRQNPV